VSSAPKIVGLEQRPDFDVALLVVRVRAALQTNIDGFVHRLDVPQQYPATSSLVSANGPSMTVRLGPESRTRLPFRGRVESLAGDHDPGLDQFPRCSLPISASIFSSGMTPASDAFVAFTITITRIVVPCLLLVPASYRRLLTGRTARRRIDNPVILAEKLE
jgi:hypothetical protein